jgi:hypothetical protein
MKLACESARRPLGLAWARMGDRPAMIALEGVTKLIEQALRHHLQVLQALPADVIAHPRLLVTRKSGEAILKQMETGKPTEALRDLMRDGD